MILILATIILSLLTTPFPVRAEERPVPRDLPDQEYEIPKSKAGVVRILGGFSERFIDFASEFWPTDNIHDVVDLYEEGEIWLESSYKPLTPLKVQEETIKPINKQYKTYTSRACIYDLRKGKLVYEKTSINRTYSDEIKEIPELRENGEQLNAFFGKHVLLKDEAIDKYDHDYPTDVVILESAHECDTELTADQLDSFITKNTREKNIYPTTGGGGNLIRITFNVFDYIVSEIFDRFGELIGYRWEAPHRMIIRPSVVCPHCTEIVSHLAGASEEELAYSSRAPHVRAKLAETQGVIDASYKPDMVQYKKVLHAERDNSFKTNIDEPKVIKTNNFGMAKTAHSLDYLACTLLPSSKQPEYDKDCSQFPIERDEEEPEPPLACKDQSFDDLGLSGGGDSCGLCNADGAYDFITSVNPDYANQLPEGKLPQAAVDVLNAAASAHQVPAGVLLGAMIHEGAFAWEDWKWTEENVRAWTVCGGSMGSSSPGDDSSCMSHAHPSTGSRGAFGWIDRWFEGYASEVQSIDPSRKDDDINQCNFLDASIAAAAAMAKTSGGHPQLTRRCGGVSINQGLGPATSCGDWNESRVATAQRMHNGECIDIAVERTVNSYNAFKCN